MARFDDIGLFWQDLPTSRKKGAWNRPMPPIPETGWTAPKEFPNLKAAKVISLDTETKDPELNESGPGWARGVGHIVGISVAVPDHAPWYFPMRHEVKPEENLDPDHVLAWAQDTLGGPQHKIGANLLYDIGWLQQEGVFVNGPLIDCQYGGGLLSERDPVNLNFMGTKYLGIPKTTDILYQWCADFYGGKPNEKQRANIWRAPPSLVGPYAESDATLPLEIMNKIYPILAQRGLLDVFNLECRLIPLLRDMRFAGAHVDLKKAEEVYATLTTATATLQEQLDNIVGMKVNVNASASLANAFDYLGLQYPRTKKGNPSFPKEFIKEVDHPIGNLIREIKSNEKLAGTFIKSYILESHINGMIYGQFHPMRGDGYGTRSGRLSSSNPNLQNIPSRHKILAPLIRGMFIPDEGHRCIRAYDYSQIEYRCLAHFAVGPSGDELRAKYNANPNTDYHQLTIDMVKAKTGQTLERKPAKNINFGLLYGMGKRTLARNLGLAPGPANNLFQAYHAGNPFVDATMSYYCGQAEREGIVRTLMGRISYFDRWEPTSWVAGVAPLPYKAALKRYGQDIKRAGSYKALNRVLQGSAADVMKKAMVECYESGVFNITGVPRLTVHDELVFSDPGGVDEAFDEVERIMVTATPLRIPLKVDAELGADWGHAKLSVHKDNAECKKLGLIA